MREEPLGSELFEDIVLETLLRGAQSVQEFWIPGEPTPNERPRVISRGGKSWAFTPKATMAARQRMFNSVVSQQRSKMEPPYTVAIKFMLSPEQKDADLDNLCKNLMDALFSNKKSIPPMPFKDDKNIQNLLCFKRIGDKPGIKLLVMKI